MIDLERLGGCEMFLYKCDFRGCRICKKEIGDDIERYRVYLPIREGALAVDAKTLTEMDDLMRERGYWRVQNAV